jgi:hypothetical protein
VAILGPDPLAQRGREQLQVLGGPVLELVEPVIAGGDQVRQPDTSDLSEGQFPGPVAVGREVLVQQRSDLHAFQVGQQERHVIDSFNLESLKDLVYHASSLYRSTNPQRRKKVSERQGSDSA